MLVSPLFQFDNAKVQKIQMQNNTFPQLFSIYFNFNIWRSLVLPDTRFQCAAVRQRGINKIDTAAT